MARRRHLGLGVRVRRAGRGGEVPLVFALGRRVGPQRVLLVLGASADRRQLRLLPRAGPRRARDARGALRVREVLPGGRLRHGGHAHREHVGAAVGLLDPVGDQHAVAVCAREEEVGREKR